MLALGGAPLLSGCTNMTEGERTMMKGDQVEDAGAMIRRGEMYVENGKALIARGEELKRQGDNPGGDKLIAEGKAREKLGQEQINQGRQLRDKNY